MKFSATIILSAFVAALPVLAIPQSATGTTAVSATGTSSSAAATTTSAEQACLAKCANGDVTCQAACITVPAPNDLMANQTTECAAKCDQGSGSPSDTQKYSDCVQGCISSYFYSPSSTIASATGTGGTAASATATGTNTSGKPSGTGASASATGTKSGSSTGTATGASASASKTNAAGQFRFGAPLAGAAGLFAVGLAL
ncbi:MAG: hypothetical protein M1824_002992 [Vezdaea acicularis]|nr:MAG: hypothetical protein M1824_002992 [Vezdaea acicularis]